MSIVWWWTNLLLFSLLDGLFLHNISCWLLWVFFVNCLLCSLLLNLLILRLLFSLWVLFSIFSVFLKHMFSIFFSGCLFLLNFHQLFMLSSFKGILCCFYQQ